MRKTALSLVVVAASAVYVWSQKTPPDSIGISAAANPSTENALPAMDAPAATSVAPAPVPAVAVETLPAAIVRPHGDDDGEDEGDDDDDGWRELPRVAAIETPAPAPLPPPAEPARVMAEVPAPRLRPAATPAAAPALTLAANGTPAGQYRDGTYTGPSVDAYYGLVQIQAIVQNGQLAAIKVLDYPSDRRTSVYINRQALPMLRDEVIRAQSARVNLISGATLTSEAFVRSLGAALSKAGA